MGADDHIATQNEPRIDAARQRQVAAALRAFLPARAVLHAAEDTRPYECDGLSMYRRLPMVVALPETEEQVRQVLTTCHAIDVPVVARGAGTGLSGGAMPASDGVLLSMAKFMRVLRVDPLARIAVVQPGVRNLVISEVAAPFGLYYAPDPSSQIACTIGGNVAENSGGVHCLKYGLTVHNVHALRGFTMAGEPFEFGSLAPDAPGLDLLALMIGSEGLLGVITEVTVKLLAQPETAQVVLAAFDDVGRAGDAVAAIIGAGVLPAGIEMMDRKAIEAVEPFVNAGYPMVEAILLVEADGTAEEVAEEIARVSDIVRRAGATEVRVSRDEAERLRFWSGRKAAFPAVGRITPDYYCMDGTVPKKRVAEVLRGIQQMEKKYGLPCANVFHAGDGNLHPLIMYDANRPDELERTERFGAEILELCVAVGGTITGEHGVGIEKIDQMCVQFALDELAAFHAVKRAFDPKGLLNPGKAVPTLARCAEFGRMHVHAGKLAHPELPRF